MNWIEKDSEHLENMQCDMYLFEQLKNDPQKSPQDCAAAVAFVLGSAVHLAESYQLTQLELARAIND